MKRINITQAATAIGVAGLLGMASIANAGDKNSGFTDPSKLQKFANVVVVNATPEQRAAAAKARPSVAQRAAVDSAGQIRPVTAEEAQALAPQVAPVTDSTTPMASAAEPATIEVNGMIGIVAGDDSLAYAVATKGSDGKVRQACIEHAANGEAALKKAAAPTGVNKNEK